MIKVKDLAKDDVFEWHGQDYVFGYACVMNKKDVAICWDVTNSRPTPIPTDVEVKKIGTLSEIIQNAKITKHTKKQKEIFDADYADYAD